MLPGSWRPMQPVTRAPEWSPAGAGPDLDAEDPTPLPSGAGTAAALPGRTDRLRLFRTLITFLNLGVLITYLPGGTEDPVTSLDMKGSGVKLYPHITG
ncbi:unnamed protein product [Gulo gulo]|uniref:Uncharacterized protein n=1 Tax=Gulo gulo TaxID=48420 RepID=A0A9X9LU59_GULGU|nr:unnamed protein product [Gulo gulo]